MAEKKKRRGITGPRPELRGPRPHLWVSGPDPRRHAQHKAWLLHRAQANFRGEPHDLTFEQWERIWNKNGAWEQRGRAVDDLCMVRKDSDGAWSKNNVEIITRHEQLIMHNQMKIGTNYKRRRDAGIKRGPNVKKSH